MKPLAEQTLYEVLDVPVDAPEGEIARAYERAQALYGPGSLATYTLMAPDEAALLVERLEEARTTLLDADARARYDARIGEDVGPPSPPRSGGEGAAAVADAPEPPRQGTLDALVAWLVDPPQLKLLPAIPAAEAVAEAAPEPTPIPLDHAAPPIPLETPAPPIALDHAAAPIPLETPAPPIALSAVAVPAHPPVSPPFAAVADIEPPPPPVAAPPPPRPRVEKDIFVHEHTRYTGDVLRRARESRGLTVAVLAERTKIARHHLENLEGDRYEKLPAMVYLRGFLMAIAKELRLDGQKVARSYLDALAAAAAASQQVPRQQSPRAR